MHSHRSSLCGAIAVAMLAHAPAIHGQVTVSVEGFAGYYRPFGHFNPASVYSTALPGQPADLQGPTWGGMAHLGIGRRYGIAAQIATASSQFGGGFTPDGLQPPSHARVLLGSLLAQYDVSPNPRAVRVWLNAGAAVIQHGGDAYRPYGSPTSFGPAFGTTIGVPLGAHLEVAADATGVFYTLDVPMPPDLRFNPGRLEHGSQRDALVHVGLMWTL